MNNDKPQRPLPWARIRLFAMDVDGVLTDGQVLVFSDGAEAKQFSILDGMGLRRILEHGIDVAWISGRPSEATKRRAKELRIPHLIQGSPNKLDTLREIARATGLAAEEVCYMGDDVIDTECLEWAGIGICVPEGRPEAIAASDVTTTRNGGCGAVREICERILEARNG